MLCKRSLHDLDNPAMVYITPSTGLRRCGPCHRTTSLRWTVANGIRLREQRLQRHAANPERQRDYTRRWLVINRERNRTHGRAWSAANPEHRLRNWRRWVAANPIRARALSHNGHARRRAAIGSDQVLAAELMALLQAARGRCLYRVLCSGAPATDFDHLVPLRPRAGEPAGRHVIANLVPSCHECNAGRGGKHNKPLDIWLPPRRAAALRTRHVKLLERIR